MEGLNTGGGGGGGSELGHEQISRGSWKCCGAGPSDRMVVVRWWVREGGCVTVCLSACLLACLPLSFSQPTDIPACFYCVYIFLPVFYVFISSCLFLMCLYLPACLFTYLLPACLYMRLTVFFIWLVTGYEIITPLVSPEEPRERQIFSASL